MPDSHLPERDRALLRMLEHDWQVAIGAIRDATDERLQEIQENAVRHEKRVRRDLRAHQAEVQKHWRRLGRSLIVLVLLGLAGMVAGLSLLQSSRIEASRRTCETRNEGNAAIVQFVRSQSPFLADEAEMAFPQTEDCGAYARDITGSWFPWSD